MKYALVIALAIVMGGVAAFAATAATVHILNQNAQIQIKLDSLEMNYREWCPTRMNEPVCQDIKRVLREHDR